MILSFLAFLSSVSTPNLYEKEVVLPRDTLAFFEPAHLPQKETVELSPAFSQNPQRSFLAYDLDSGKILLQKNMNRAQPIASLTKLMTALIILENHDLDEEVIVPYEATEADGVRIEIYEHEKLTVKTLLEAALIPSANDAAVALAFHHSGNEALFVEKMNAKAKELGLHSAHFLNATGLDIMTETNSDEEFDIHGNQMSSWDLLTLARIAWESEFIRDTVAQDHFYGNSVDEKFFHEKKSTNQLLDSFLDIKGLKTGFTYLAGECFIAVGENEQGHSIFSVVLGSIDRFGETKDLLSWVYDVYE